MEDGRGVPPRFAVVRLRSGDDVFNLFRILLQHGYTEVSFVQGLKDSVLPWALNGQNLAGSDGDPTSPPADSNSDSDSNSNNNPRANSEEPLPANPPSVSSSYSLLPIVRPPIFGNESHSSPQISSAVQPDLLPQPPTTSAVQFSRTEAATPPYSLSAGSIFIPRTMVPDCQASINNTGFVSNLPMTVGTKPTAFMIPEVENPKSQLQPMAMLAPISLQNPVPLLPFTATTQLRQRGSRAQSDDPNVFVACRLCHNKIMASRLSNLTNHVRRHSTLKQFQCCYCDYTHNEMAKVRLHMLHNHKDKDSQPIDNLSPEMQAAWDVLMQQCFPEQYQGSGQAQQMLLRTDVDELEIGKKPVASRDEQNPCLECGQLMPAEERAEHIHRNHLNCFPYVCSVCGYEHSDPGKVMLHIALKHASNAAAKVFTRDTATIAEALIPKYFRVPSQVLFRSEETPSHRLSQGGPSLPAIFMPHNPPPLFSAPIPPVPMFNFSSPFHPECRDRQLAENLRCHLCRKVLDGIRPLSSLLNHAKRHYHLKQFQCTDCPYSSSEAAHVRSHMKLKHNIRGRSPLDNRSQSLQAAWMQTMVRCFPSIAPRLKKFRFKNFRNKPSGRPRLREHSETESPSPEAATTTAAESPPTSAAQEPGPATEQVIMVKQELDVGTPAEEEMKPNTGEEKETGRKECRLCQEWVREGDQFQHATTHIPMKPFGCSICPFRTVEYQQLRVHLWKHKLTGGDRVKARLDNVEVNALRAEYVKHCFGEL